MRRKVCKIPAKGKAVPTDDPKKFHRIYSLSHGSLSKTVWHYYDSNGNIKKKSYQHKIPAETDVAIMAFEDHMKIINNNAPNNHYLRKAQYVICELSSNQRNKAIAISDVNGKVVKLV